MAQSPLPTRMVAILFTDLVGSTALKSQHGAMTYNAILERHDALFRTCINLTSGKILQGTGDGFFASFERASDAVRCALLFQHAMGKEDWGGIEFQSRAGIDVGEVTELPQPDGGVKLVGLVIDLASRIMSLATAGQILLTRSPFNDARQFIREYPPSSPRDTCPALRWIAHGSYIFKGADSPTEVFEVGGEGMAPLTAPPDGEKARRAGNRFTATLAELCEPLFHYVLRLNRSARKGGVLEHGQVRLEVTALLHSIQGRAKADPTLSAHMDKNQGGIYHVLLFFVDFMIHNSKLSFANEWKNLAFDEKEMAGDEKFFNMLAMTLADKCEAATERIAIYYTCMGVGFTGSLSGQPEQLRKKMLDCTARMRGRIDADDMAPVCPQAYKADTRALFKPIRSNLVGITITLIVLTLAILTIDGYQYYQKFTELNATMQQLKSHPDTPAHAGK